MQTYREKIAPGIEKLAHAALELNHSNVDWAHEISHQLFEAEDLLLNRFQTVPKERFIHITASLCDPEGSSDKAYCDVIIKFEREITAASLYILLDKYVTGYNKKYYLQVSLQQVEEWLNKQKSLYRTVHRTESGFIEDTGLTIADHKTSYGSIDFFMEYGISFPNS